MPTIDPAALVRAIDLLTETGLLAYDTADDRPLADVIAAVADCDHPHWSGRGYGGADGYRCDWCGAGSELVLLLGGSAHLSQCGHVLDTEELFADLGSHVDAALIGDGSFWSCAIDMPGWAD